MFTASLNFYFSEYFIMDSIPSGFNPFHFFGNGKCTISVNWQYLGCNNVYGIFLDCTTSYIDKKNMIYFIIYYKLP